MGNTKNLAETVPCIGQLVFNAQDQNKILFSVVAMFSERVIVGKECLTSLSPESYDLNFL
jgi:hypothetical protein